MKQVTLTVIDNKPLTSNVCRMRLSGDVSAFTAPGQFANFRITGLYLRRPISVCDLGENMLTVIYKVVGEGTARMRDLRPGETLDTLTGLGNGYDIACAGKYPLLVGGGVGVPPMYCLAKKLLALGASPRVILGFNTKDEVFYEEEFRDLGCGVTVTTVDGSYGIKGFVTAALPENATYLYACGPEPMLKALYKASDLPAQFSFEERMGCGFGACMGCTCKTVTGYKRICKDGPVLRREEILWEK